MQAGLRPEQQAKQQITVQPFAAFSSLNQNYLYISTGTNTVSVGDRLSLKMSISAKHPIYRHTHITYMVRQEHSITIPLQHVSNTHGNQEVQVEPSATKLY